MKYYEVMFSTNDGRYKIKTETINEDQLKKMQKDMVHGKITIMNIKEKGIGTEVKK